MSFRLILQPAVAILLALRAGMRDAREGRPPFLWAVLSDQSCRRELMRQGWKDVGNVFLVALALDSIYQVLVHSGIYALELLLAATILALVPYVAVRGLVTPPVVGVRGPPPPPRRKTIGGVASRWTTRRPSDSGRRPPTRTADRLT